MDREQKKKKKTKKKKRFDATRYSKNAIPKTPCMNHRRVFMMLKSIDQFEIIGTNGETDLIRDIGFCINRVTLDIMDTGFFCRLLFLDFISDKISYKINVKMIKLSHNRSKKINATE